MQPGTQDITIYQGDDYELFFRVRALVWDPDANGGAGGYVPGDYVDLTGFTPKAQIRPSAGSATLLAEFTATLANQTDPDTKGGVYLTLDSAETTDLPTTGGKWDVQLTEDATLKVQTYLRGSVTVTAEVTV